MELNSLSISYQNGDLREPQRETKEMKMGVYALTKTSSRTLLPVKSPYYIILYIIFGFRKQLDFN